MKTFLITILLYSSLFAGTYDYTYTVDVDSNESNSSELELDSFMGGEFEEIVRFNMLHFDGDSLENEYIEDTDIKYFDYIVETIKTYIARDKDIKIKIIGHTNEPTDKHNELVVDSDTYANTIQNWFRPSLSTEQSDKLSKSYAQTIQSMLVDSNISKELMLIENRRGDDMGFSDSLSEGKELSNRVMLTLYVSLSNKIELDTDEDTVFDKQDKCPDTPKGVIVDVEGCPLDSDGDGVYDYLDDCPNTPKNVTVDKKGCPLDSDSDGVVDYKDRCPNTHIGLSVDINGCPLGRTLKLNFRTSSDKILKESYPEVVAFAEFMAKNPAYDAKIVGHTDSSGQANKNMTLSKKRAISVKIALVAEGVSASRLVTDGRGELEPIQSNRTKAGRKENRRIEVELSLRD